MPSCSSQDVDRFIETLPSYDAVFYKALASNDHTWVYPGKSHQAGVLIPRQTVSFFGIDPAADMNKMLELTVRWLLGGSIFTREDMPNPGRYRNTRIRYYCGGNRKRPDLGVIDMGVALLTTEKGTIIKQLNGFAVAKEPAHHWFVVYGTKGSLEQGRRASGLGDSHYLYIEDRYANVNGPVRLDVPQ